MKDFTLDYYNKNAKVYAENTIKGDVSQVRSEFLKHVPIGGEILDLGCGSGRDSLVFKELGYQVTAMDGSYEMCKEASRVLGQEVLCKQFDEINEQDKYDAIWACASLLHVPSDQIKDIMDRLIKVLNEEGAMYLSVKEGDFEGIREGRYFTDYTEDKIKEIVQYVKHAKIEKLWKTLEQRNNEYISWINILIKK